MLVRVPTSDKSRPDEKCFPLPDKTTTLQFSSVLIARKQLVTSLRRVTCHFKVNLIKTIIIIENIVRKLTPKTHCSSHYISWVGSTERGRRILLEK